MKTKHSNCALCCVKIRPKYKLMLKLMVRIHVTTSYPILWFPLYDPTRAVVVHLNFRAGSTFTVQVCTVSPRHRVKKQTLNRTSQCNKVDAVRLQVEFTLTIGSEVRVKGFYFYIWKLLVCCINTIGIFCTIFNLYLDQRILIEFNSIF